jgi:hypothetical protein
LLALAVGLAAFAWLDHINPPFLATDDGVRDQLLVRDCVELGRCHRIGPPTSLPGVHHGAVWLDLLTAVRLLGGDVSSQRTVMVSLLALSVATLFVVIWHWVRPSIAFPAAILMIAGLALEPHARELNPSGFTLPDILTAAGLLCYGLSGRRRFLFVSACGLGAAINVHVGSLSLVPPLLAIAMLGRPRAWGGMLASMAMLTGTYLLTSSAALRGNTIALVQRGRLLPLLAGGFAVVLLAATLGASFRRQSREARAWTISGILILPFGVASLWLVGWEGHHFSAYYLHPILGPAAALAAALLVLPFEVGARRWRTLKWIPTAAALAAVMVVSLQFWRPASAAVPPPDRPWSLAEAAAIGDRAIGQGWNYEDLVYRVQSTECRALVIGMSLATPPPAAPPRQGRRQLQVVKGPREALAAMARPEEFVALGPTTAAVVRDVDSWLQPETLRACRVPLEPRGEPRCEMTSPRSSEQFDWERFLFLRRWCPEIHPLDLPPPYVATYEIPLSPVAGESRELVVADVYAPGCSWRITRVEGVRVEGQLPAGRVRLHADSGDRALVVLERPIGVAACPVAEFADTRYPPCVFDAQPGDPLLTLVGER